MEAFGFLFFCVMFTFGAAYAAVAIATALGIAFVLWRTNTLVGKLIVLVKGVNAEKGYERCE